MGFDNHIIGPNTFSVDADLGDFFLNFLLEELLQFYSGIDLSPFVNDLKFAQKIKKKVAWLKWLRQWMGLKSSPYHCVRFFIWQRNSQKETKDGK